MNIIRNEQQASLNALGIALQESVDHFQYAIDILEKSTETALMEELASNRQAFVERVDAALRELGELPGKPDDDRETVANLIHRLTALFASDGASKIIEQRLVAEQHLAGLAADARQSGVEGKTRELVDDVALHIQDATDQLQAALRHHEKATNES